MEKYQVSLTDEERDALTGLLKKGKAAARRIAHARILLLADEGQDDEAIAQAVAVSPRTINRVRKRLVTEGFLAALDHKPQPPRPDNVKIKGDVEQELVRIACSDPPEGRCHWTLQLLADELIALGVVQSVSTETVRQALKKNEIDPWIVKTWCIPPDADGEYVWHMEDVIQTYMLPYDARRPVVCFDEASRQLFGEVPATASGTGQARQDGLRIRTQGHLQPVHDVRTAAWLASGACDKSANEAGLCRVPQGTGGRALPQRPEDHAGSGQPEHALGRQSVRAIPATRGPAHLAQGGVPLHAQARQLAQPGRVGDQHHEPSVPRLPFGLPNEGCQRCGPVAEQAQPEGCTRPLDLHSGRRTPETTQSLPDNRRLTEH
jgi:transposase